MHINQSLRSYSRRLASPASELWYCVTVKKHLIIRQTDNLQSDIWHCWTCPMRWNPKLIRVYTNSWPCYQTRSYYRLSHFTKFRDSEVSIVHLQLAQHANRDRLLLRKPDPVPFLTCIYIYVLILRPVSPELVLFPDLELRIPLSNFFVNLVSA